VTGAGGVVTNIATLSGGGYLVTELLAAFARVCFFAQHRA